MSTMIDEIEEKAAKLILRRTSHGWSAQDEAALKDWLDESPLHKVVFVRLNHGWSQIDKISAEEMNHGWSQIDNISAEDMYAPQPAFLFGLRRIGAIRGMALAASLMLMLMLVGWWGLNSTRSNPTFAEYSTDVGGRKLLTLSDGTLIDLNTSTNIRIYKDQSNTTVVLNTGEAYFDIGKNKKGNLVVFSGDHRITDIGTKFLVRRSSEMFMVAVAEGKVQIVPKDRPAAGKALTISAGDIAESIRNSSLTATRGLDYVNALLSWRDGVIQLDGMTLAQAAEQFNRYNLRKLVLEDEAVRSQRIAGSFDPRDELGFSRLLRDAYGLEIEEGEQEIRISSRKE